MNEKTVYIILIIISIILLSGCTTKQETSNEEQELVIKDNLPPEINIKTAGTLQNPPSYVSLSKIDAIAYEGDTITFDASDSYDPEGKTLSYHWICYDNIELYDPIITHQFQIDNIYELNGLPIIYSITLIVKDDEVSSLKSFQIGIIPKNHIFYLDNDGLNLEKPDTISQTIKVTLDKLRESTILEYELEKVIKIQKNKWKTTLYIEKPLITIIKKITITLYNKTGKEISRSEKQFSIFEFWREKNIELSGEIQKLEEFKSVSIKINGFSIRNKVNIFYGGEKPSNIVFDFTNN